ncbi:MAG: RcnB family protein [Pseudomonadota bacterium]|nr:RcnB family protein [Pseudomonadota bacterium]
MAVTREQKSADRLSAKLSALVLGTALLALPGAAMAQQDQHRGENRGQDQQQARPAPAPAPAQAPRANAAPVARPAPMAPMERRGNWRAPAQWNGQPRQMPGNPAVNGWQGRAQPNFAPGQGQPAYRGQTPYQGQPQGQPRYAGQPAYQGQNRGNGDQWRGEQRYAGSQPGYERTQHGYERGPQGYDRGEHGGQWNHGWRQDNRYDWRDYREANRDEFHAGRYYAPYRDYSYDRLGVGFYLQPLFFGQDYWIADPWDYHLPPAYGPYQWVRYYNDVLLVNVDTGQVADVIYDFFW